jgi:hypothetical protein
MNPRNPFYVLELGAEATPGEIERQGKKLLGLFELGVAKARKYTCPLGTFDRDDTAVRDAMAALRDPARRAKEATLVRLLAPTNERVPPEPDAPFEEIFQAVGYRGL